jgi:hypothetical protein
MSADCERGSHNATEIVMQAFAILLVLFVNSATTARAQQSNDCKVCRDVQQACLKAHSRQACSGDYGIFMKHCRKK